MSDNFLPGDIRFFREQFSRLNKNLIELNKNLVALSERVSDEVAETVHFEPFVPGENDAPHRKGTWVPDGDGSMFQVNTYLFMRTHQVKGDPVVPGINGKWAGFLEVVDSDGVVLWEVAGTEDVYDTEELCKKAIERLTNSFLDEWDANTNPIGED